MAADPAPRCEKQPEQAEEGSGPSSAQLVYIRKFMAIMDTLPASCRRLIHEGYPMALDQLEVLATWSEERAVEWLEGYNAFVRRELETALTNRGDSSIPVVVDPCQKAEQRSRQLEKKNMGKSTLTSGKAD